MNSCEVKHRNVMRISVPDTLWEKEDGQISLTFRY